MKQIRFVKLLILIPCLAVMLCSCANLGNYEDLDDYYASFDEIAFISQFTGSNDPVERFDDFSKFYSKETQDDFECCVDEQDYKYIVLKTAKTIKIKSFSLWTYSTDGGLLSLTAYLTSKFPSNFKEKSNVDASCGKYVYTYNDVTYSFSFDGKTSNGEGTVTDQDGKTASYTYDSSDEVIEFRYTEKDGDDNVTSDKKYYCTFSEEYTILSVRMTDVLNEFIERYTYKYEESDDSVECGLFSSYMVSQVSTRLTAGKWDSFTLSSWTVDGSKQKYISVPSDKYLIIKINNNTLDATRKKLDAISFKATNLMVEAC